MLQSIVLDYLFGENCVCKIQLFSKKCAKKKKRNMTSYKSKKCPKPSEFKYAKKCAGLCIQEKLKLCKFPVKASTQKFLSEIVHSID